MNPSKRIVGKNLSSSLVMSEPTIFDDKIMDVVVTGVSFA
jgi:hypothetical protein